MHTSERMQRNQEQDRPADPQQASQNAQNKQPQQQKNRKEKKPRIVLRPDDFEKPKGLKKLYQLTNQIKWQDTMTVQNAMDLVVLTLKSWQYQLMPKYYNEYFFQRCQALGSHKQVTAYMNKVRRIHKGADMWDEGKPENIDPNGKSSQKQGDVKSRKGNKNQGSDGEGIDLGGNFEAQYQDYDDQQQKGNDMQKFKQKTEFIAPQAPKTQQQQVDELIQQDLRMFQQMTSKKSPPKPSNNEDSDQGIDLDADIGIEIDDYYDD